MTLSTHVTCWQHRLCSVFHFYDGLWQSKCYLAKISVMLGAAFRFEFSVFFVGFTVKFSDFTYKRGCREPLSSCILRAQKLSLRFCGKIHRSQAELQRLVQGVTQFIWKATSPTSGHVLFLGYQLFLGWRWFHPSLPDSRCSRWSLPGR